MHGIELHFVDHEYAYASGTRIMSSLLQLELEKCPCYVSNHIPLCLIDTTSPTADGAVVQAGGRAEAQPNWLRDKPRAPPIRVYSKSVIGCIRSFACGG
jgi:hypothetical protein